MKTLDNNSKLAYDDARERSPAARRQGLSERLDMRTVVDCGVALVALSLLWPFFLLIGLCVRIDSAGPMFYRRRVMGRGGSTFDAIKFRTMYVDGDEILARHPDLQEELRTRHKLRSDPRVTRVGRWLRRLSLDETPQLLNVLRGEMRLVGPRMITPSEIHHYGERWRDLLTIKPGLTGLWQVSGRSDLAQVDRVRLDLEYVDNHGFWSDLKILFVDTPPAVLRQRGAY